MNRANTIRYLYSIPLLLIFIVAGIASVRAGIADLYSYSPRQHLEHWEKIGKPPSPEALAKELNSIEAALSWQKANAEYWDMQALLQYYQALQKYRNDDNDGFLSSAKLAANSYREAIKTRPNWPYSWANLAFMKAAVNQFDSEYQQALNQAVLLGPWEDAVNISVAQAGMLGWAALPPATQTAVIANIERGIKRNNTVLKKRLNEISRLELTCIYLQSSKERKRLCGF